MRLPDAYAARQVRFLELWEHEGWRMKVYGISYRAERPPVRLMEAAKRLAAGCLPQPAVVERRYGVGFVGAHEGRDANLVFVDWWENQNELHHHVFVSTLERGSELEDVTGTGLAACVWDLAVIGFERRAWIDTMLVGPSRPGLDAYLASRFEGAV